MLCMVVTMLAGPGGFVVGNFKNILIAVVIFFVGRSLLTYIAKIDPYMSEVFRRSVLYRAEYPACSTVGFKNSPKPNRW